MLYKFVDQTVQSDIWLWLGISFVIAIAMFRFGRQILLMLGNLIDERLQKGLIRIWLVLVAIGWISYGIYKAGYSQVPVLFNLGTGIANGFKMSAGQFVVLLAMALVAWRLVGAIADRVVAPDEFNRRSVRVQTLKSVVESALKVVIVVVTALGLLQNLGVNITSLLAGVSVLGIAIGFGAQSLVKDVFTGFFILLEDQYGVGDFITINTGALAGTVEDLNLRVTTLRALDGTAHIIPNGQINTVSVSSKDWSNVVATIDVSYNADINQALKVMEVTCFEMYKDSEWNNSFLEEPDVHGVTNLGADGITLRTIMRVKPKAQWAIEREFNRRIKIAMDQAEIEIPFPQRTLSFGAQTLDIRVVNGESLNKVELDDLVPQNVPVQPSK